MITDYLAAQINRVWIPSASLVIKKKDLEPMKLLQMLMENTELFHLKRKFKSLKSQKQKETHSEGRSYLKKTIA